MTPPLNKGVTILGIPVKIKLLWGGSYKETLAQTNYYSTLSLSLSDFSFFPKRKRKPITLGGDQL